jgi:uncharacterized membrane protein YeaQ/YmgE (transglycosylase-associated protein family)
MGFVASVLTGIAGALVGGYLFQRVGGAGITGLNLYSLFVAVVGAVGLLTVAKWVFK